LTTAACHFPWNGDCRQPSRRVRSDRILKRVVTLGRLLRGPLPGGRALSRVDVRSISLAEASRRDGGDSRAGEDLATI